LTTASLESWPPGQSGLMRDAEGSFEVGELLDLFSEEECANYFKNSGYVSE
jgi:hypothetical protein